MHLDSKIYIAGHRGMVGSAIKRMLVEKGYSNIVGKSSSTLNLTRQSEVEAFFAIEKPDYVFLAAAKVGGIHANNIYRADFLYENLMIATNVIHSSASYNVKKLLFMGSSCIYPKLATQPLRESALLTGPLEPTNEPYAIAKIASIKLCENYRRQYGCDFISIMPTNLYGPGDNYNLETSHVVPAIIRKTHEAKVNKKSSMSLWGTGTPIREFMHVDDLASACYLIMQNYSEEEFINVGSGEEISIWDLVQLVKKVVGYKGEIITDRSKPDGAPRKFLDCTKLSALGFRPQYSLQEGIAMTYKEYKASKKQAQ